MKTPYWFPLFKHMQDTYGMTLTDSELHEIGLKVDECRHEHHLEAARMNDKEVERFVKDREGMKE